MSWYKNNKLKKTQLKLYYLGQWQFDGTTLSNKEGFALTGTWKIPSFGIPGTIQNTAKGESGYLSVNANTDAGSVVVMEALDSSDVGQQWERLYNDLTGYFTLKNPNSGLFLTKKFGNKLTIGNALIYCVVVFLPCSFLPTEQEHCYECECSMFNVFYPIHWSSNGVYEVSDTVNGIIKKNADKHIVTVGDPVAKTIGEFVGNSV